VRRGQAHNGNQAAFRSSVAGRFSMGRRSKTEPIEGWQQGRATEDMTVLKMGKWNPKGEKKNRANKLLNSRKRRKSENRSSGGRGVAPVR